MRRKMNAVCFATMTVSGKLSEWAASVFEKMGAGAAGGMNIEVVSTARPEFGDYQCNGAMSLAKVLKKSPRQIAELFVQSAGAHEAVAKIEVAGPGFLNFFLKDEWLVAEACGLADDARLHVPQIGAGKRVVMDYGSPNVAKPMHIGHTRSMIIGSALDRIHRCVGYDVIADNHVGDWGTQFGILIMGYRNFLDAEALEKDPIQELERLYVQSYRKTKEDDSWLEKCRAELVKLQGGDEENLALWRRFIELSMGEFGKMFGRLGVKFDLNRGESFYNGMLQGVIDRLQDAGLVKESEGALIVEFEEDKLPVSIVRKSDGGFNYATTDIATIISREQEFSPEKIVYVTDERQQLHFSQVFSVCRRLGIKVELQHVWFGLMRLPEGTFSTREGNVIPLEKMLDEAERRALAIVAETSPEMSSDQQKEVARKVGIGALKYADLSQNPQTLIVFSWDKALSLDGNSGPYLQYAYARISSVRDKYAERFGRQSPDSYPVSIGHPVERDLLLRVCRYPEVVLKAALNFRPNYIAEYLYDLAQAYSSFYQNLPFLKAEEGVRESRVRICGMVATVLKAGLGLLGIDTPERI